MAKNTPIKKIHSFYPSLTIYAPHNDFQIRNILLKTLVRWNLYRYGIESIGIQKIYRGSSMFSIKPDKDKRYSKSNNPEGGFKS
jgi:hypothetical protein